MSVGLITDNELKIRRESIDSGEASTGCSLTWEQSVYARLDAAEADRDREALACNELAGKCDTLQADNRELVEFLEICECNCIEVDPGIETMACKRCTLLSKHKDTQP